MVWRGCGGFGFLITVLLPLDIVDISRPFVLRYCYNTDAVDIGGLVQAKLNRGTVAAWRQRAISNLCCVVMTKPS